MGPFSRLSLKARFYVAVAIAAILVGAIEGWLSNGPLIRCATLRWRNFDAVAPGVYVGRSGTPDARRVLLDALATSKATVAGFFGVPPHRGTVVLCPDARQFKELTGAAQGTAITLRAPFGDYVVVRPSEHLGIVLSHELVHAEIDHRLSWWTAETKLPMWFIEGLSMVASGDTRFDAERLRESAKRAGHLPSLAELESTRQFQRLASKDPALAYGPAYLEVSLWYRSAGKKGLEAVLDGLARGGKFDSLYREAERRAVPPNDSGLR